MAERLDIINVAEDVVVNMWSLLTKCYTGLAFTSSAVTRFVRRVRKIAKSDH